MAANNEQQIPVQPVENPILCSPYKEPDQHWPYDHREVRTK
jgi:type III restriction enzyme